MSLYVINVLSNIKNKKNIYFEIVIDQCIDGNDDDFNLMTINEINWKVMCLCTFTLTKKVTNKAVDCLISQSDNGRVVLVIVFHPSILNVISDLYWFTFYMIILNSKFFFSAWHFCLTCWVRSTLYMMRTSAQVLALIMQVNNSVMDLRRIWSSQTKCIVGDGRTDRKLFTLQITTQNYLWLIRTCSAGTHHHLNDEASSIYAQRPTLC